ncbi:MAG: Cys-Gln thioester bond-forming surface protein [Lachnospiraceae bacterium]|nr:Cys-Gln thioester bond-forming surface protein [Lachnospiraceae bacterium]
MKKKIPRITALVLTASILMSLFSLPANAEELPEAEEPTVIVSLVASDGESGSETQAVTVTESGEGTVSDPRVTVSESSRTDENGTVTDTTETKKIWKGENEDGAVVTGSEETIETTVTDADGRKVEASGKTEGSETTASVETSEEQLQDKNRKETSEIVSSDVEEGKTITGEEAVTGSNTTDLEVTQPELSVELKPGEEKTVTKEPEVDWTAPKPGTTENEDGSTTTVEEIYEDDVLVGYRVTTSKVTKTQTGEGKITSGESDISYGEWEDVETTVKTKTEAAPGWTRPADEAPVTDEDGNTTVTVITDVVNSEGTVIGYKLTRKTTDQSGRVIAAESETVTGTDTTVTTVVTQERDRKTVTRTIVETPTTVTTSVSTSILYLPDVSARELTGWMSEVNGGQGHGSVEVTSPEVTDQEPEKEGAYDWQTKLFHRVDGSGEWSDLEGYDFQWLGEYGLESAVRVATADNPENTWQAHQFVLEDENGAKYYVYCADFEVSPQNGYHYYMENLEDADYYDEEAAKHIRAIAQNGYWGTQEKQDGDGTQTGIGSLAKLKQDLLAALEKAGEKGESFPLTEDQIRNLSEGEALTATQAAIWRFGNSGDKGLDDSDIVGKYWISDVLENGAYVYMDAAGVLRYSGHWYDGTPEQKASYESRIQGLYNYLITLTEEPAQGTTLITENHFAKGTEITVGDRVVDSDGNVVQVGGRDLYHASVKFSMSVVPSQDTDDLIVTVYDSEGNPYATARLAGGDGSDTTLGLIYPDEYGVYTLPNLKLPNGTVINLQLLGTQNLKQGVYLYTSEIRDQESSQTFVGIAEGKRNVNLNVQLRFEVKEGSASASEETRSREDTRTDLVTTCEVTTEEAVETRQLTTVEKEREYNWNRVWKYADSSVDSGEDGSSEDDKDNDSGKAVVRIAGIPVTGDRGDVWYLLAAVSGVVLLVLMISGKKKKTAY